MAYKLLQEDDNQILLEDDSDLLLEELVPFSGQKFEPLVQEDLNVGTERVWVQAPGRGRLRSTQLGLHSLSEGQTACELAWDPGAIGTTDMASTTITVPGAEVGDFVRVAHDGMLTNNLRLTGFVSATDTVTAVLHNPTTASVTITGTLRAMALRSR